MWSWGRGRRQPDPPPAGPPAAASAAGWRVLPPIQRAVAEHPMRNPPTAFQRSLATWQDPRLLAPLAHVIGPAEPSGVIDLSDADGSPRSDPSPVAPSLASFERPTVAPAAEVAEVAVPAAAAPLPSAVAVLPSAGTPVQPSPPVEPSPSAPAPAVQRSTRRLGLGEPFVPPSPLLPASAAVVPFNADSGPPDPPAGASNQPAAEPDELPVVAPLGVSRTASADSDQPLVPLTVVRQPKPADPAPDAGPVTVARLVGTEPFMPEIATAGWLNPTARAEHVEPPRADVALQRDLATSPTASPVLDAGTAAAPATGTATAPAPDLPVQRTALPGPAPSTPAARNPAAPGPAPSVLATSGSTMPIPAPTAPALSSPPLSAGTRPSSGPSGDPARPVSPQDVSLHNVSLPAVSVQAVAVPAHASRPVSLQPGSGLPVSRLSSDPGGWAAPSHPASSAGRDPLHSAADHTGPDPSDTSTAGFGPPTDSGPSGNPGNDGGYTALLGGSMAAGVPGPTGATHPISDPAPSGAGGSPTVSRSFAALTPGGGSNAFSGSVSSRGAGSGREPAPGSPNVARFPESMTPGPAAIRDLPPIAGASQAATTMPAGGLALSTVDSPGPTSFSELVGAAHATQPIGTHSAGTPVVSRSAAPGRDARPAPSTVDGGGLSLRFAAPPQVQRVTEPAAHPPAELAAVPSNVFQITTTVQRQADPVATTGPAPPQMTAPPAAAEPEELLAKLYDPLLRRIKAELLIDRDRCGSLTDLRR